MHVSPRRRFEGRFIALLVVCDLLVCACAVVLAYTVRASFGPGLLAPLRHSPVMYLRALPVVLAIWFIVFASLGMYEPRRTLSPIAARGADFRAVSLTVLMVASASFLSHHDYSRLILLQFWAFGVTLTWVSRSLLGRYYHEVVSSGRADSRALIVGCGELGRLVLQRLREYHFGFEPVGFVRQDAPPPRRGGIATLELEYLDGLPVLGTVAQLPRLLHEHEVSEVLVADPAVPAGALMEAIGDSGRHGVQFLILAGPLQVLTAQTELAGPADLPVLELGHPAFGPIQRLVKRACDVVLALLLVLLTSPLLLGIAIAIRRQTGETALFRQRRVGYRGREFVMFKFRTMRAEAEAYAPSPDDPEDPRITPIGRWLRRYSLDELPQLFNVLRGEMSIVGPRPEMPFIVEQYEPWQRHRLEALPGMTGLWQILGRKDLPLRENIEYDFYYIRNQSLLLDLAIFLRTLPIVVLGRGAY